MSNELIADGQLLGDYNSDVVSALIPFAYWYDLNDCDNSTKGHIEVPIEDLRRAYNAIGDENIAERYHLQNVVMHTELIERPLCPDTLEAAAKVADEHSEDCWTMRSESLSVSQGRNKASKLIAQKIRNLKGEL